MEALIEGCALLTIDDYELLSQTNLDKKDVLYITSLINFVSSAFVGFCARPLKERKYTFDPDGLGFDPDFSIFDGVRGDKFFFPTYPVSSVETLIISKKTIEEAVEYSDTSGFFLYKKKGLIQYLGGFDFGAKRNIKVCWTGGHPEGSPED